MFMNSKPHLWVMLDTWVCWLCSTSFLNKDTCSPSMFVDAIRLFPPSYQALAACGKHERFDHEGFSACFPRAICFVSRRDRFSPALLLWVSQAMFSCAGCSTCTIRS